MSYPIQSIPVFEHCGWNLSIGVYMALCVGFYDICFVSVRAGFFARNDPEKGAGISVYDFSPYHTASYVSQ